MENINIKFIFDEVFGKSCDSITCDTYKYKEDCTLINKFINDIKDKGLSPDQYVKGLALFVFVLKEQKYINDFGKTQEDIIKLVTKDGFELDWLINRWCTVIEYKDILKPIIAAFPKYAKNLLENVVSDNAIINKRIADYIIHTSEVEHKAIMELLNYKEEDNKLKSFSDDELKQELDRRQTVGK